MSDIPICPIHHRPHVVVTWCPACRGGHGGKATSPRKRRASQRNARKRAPRAAPTRLVLVNATHGTRVPVRRQEISRRRLQAIMRALCPGDPGVCGGACGYLVPGTHGFEPVEPARGADSPRWRIVCHHRPGDDPTCTLP